MERRAGDQLGTGRHSPVAWSIRSGTVESRQHLPQCSCSHAHLWPPAPRGGSDMLLGPMVLARVG